MTRLPDIDPSTATGAVGKTLDEFAERSGPPGPMVRAMANSSALLRGYVDVNRAMKRSHLNRQVGERVSLAVQAWIGCDYCLASHTETARRLGPAETDIDLARRGTAVDPKMAALVAFGQQLIAAPARIADADIEALHDHGWRDEQIADVVGLVALNLMTGAFNLAAGIHSGVETAATA